mgnify:FL=1
MLFRSASIAPPVLPFLHNTSDAMLSPTASITLLATLLATFASVDALPKPTAAPRSATLAGRRTPGQNELYKRNGVFDQVFLTNEIGRLNLKYGPKSRTAVKSALADATVLPLSAINLKDKRATTEPSNGTVPLTGVSACFPKTFRLWWDWSRH